MNGRVDSRLLITLAALTAQQHKVYVTSFGEAGPNAAAAVPLRMVRIAALAGGHGRHRGAYQHAVIRFLHAQRPPFLGTVSVLRQGRRTMIQLQFPAPGPARAARRARDAMTGIVTFRTRAAGPPGRTAVLLQLPSLPTLTPSPPALTLSALTPRINS